MNLLGQSTHRTVFCSLAAWSLTLTLVSAGVSGEFMRSTEPEGFKESGEQGSEGTCDSRSGSCTGAQGAESGSDGWKWAKSIYEFSAVDIDGNTVNLEKYRGHVLLVVNVACFCGYTAGHYAQLQQLYAELGSSHGLRILAFPCNQFGQQEPGSNAEIKQFTAERGVTFDLFSKVEVNGRGAHPLWKYLKHRLADGNDWSIEWNFAKFIVDKSGQPVAHYSHSVEPLALRGELSQYF